MRIAQDINRFGVLHRGIDGISKNMLTRELRALEKNNIISRKIYAEIPPRVEYSLTKKGKTLVPVFDMLNEWALDYIWIWNYSLLDALVHINDTKPNVIK